MDHAFPPPLVLVPVAGRSERFPAHRSSCVGRNQMAHRAGKIIEHLARLGTAGARSDPPRKVFRGRRVWRGATCFPAVFGVVGHCAPLGTTSGRTAWPRPGAL